MDKVGPSHPSFRGARKHTSRVLPPSFKGKKVELVSMTPSKRHVNRWEVIVKINGWPSTLKLWGKDELAIMNELVLMQQENNDDHS